MGRRKANRTFEEEQEFQRLKRERNAENQRKCRERKKKASAAATLIQQNNDNAIIITDTINSTENVDDSVPSTSHYVDTSSAEHPKWSNSCLNVVISKAPSPFVVRNVYCTSSVMTRAITSSTLAMSVTNATNNQGIIRKNDCVLPSTSCNVDTTKITSTSATDGNNYTLRNNTDKPNENVEMSQKLMSFANVNASSATFTDRESKGNMFNLNSASSVSSSNYRARKKGFENIDLYNTVENYIGAMDVACEHCSAKHFQSEKISNKGNSFNDCCSHGKVMLEPLPPLPDELEQLFAGEHPKSAHFFERIRGYNNSFSFASFNANLVNLNSQRRGPYCFKIQGQIYNQINTALYPAANESASYGQLFILDSNEATECRLNQNSNLNDDLLHTLDNIMRTNNIFAQSYVMMHEEVENQEQKSGVQVPNLSMAFLTKKTGIDRRRYNVQMTNEVAAIFSTTADGEILENYVTIRNKRDKSLRRVSSMNPNVEPWVYPLYYPFGTLGWHEGIKQVNGKRVTRTMYVQYRMAVRDDNTPILKGKRLFQQWVVDQYVKIEKDRIDWCKENQKKLRVESYQGLFDYLHSTAAHVGAQVGRVMILPSTFIGSPRNMVQNYQDAMAIVRKYGKPDLFVTMTCNPNWREIKENLLPGQQPADRPDICARVFDIKKNYLLDVILRQQFFGEVLSFVYVIEFQKRGLPHIHILITLKQNCKIDTPQKVDKYVSAEIPDPSHDQNLHDIVMKNMIHGPCGDWCIVDGKCSKKFPKSFHPETTMDENGYPKYRRQDTGVIYEKNGGFAVDNRYVVPYCPKLSIIFNCHINVEVVSSIKSVKYLYKYLYKFHELASLVIGENTNDKKLTHDEIKDFVEARYVGPVEACWRIQSKLMQEKSHAIIRLPVHLQNEQSVSIRDDNITEDALRNAIEHATMLIDYFALNARDVEARQYLYTDIPLHYVFKRTVNADGKQTRRWEKRQTFFKCIGRMYSVSPTQTELFHLRILLLNVKGAKSFQELKTVNGEVLQTYADACLALGLIEDDDEWRRALNEAKIWMMPRRLRLLFVRILMHCQPVHPNALWDEFQNSLSEDFVRRFGERDGIRKTYIQIDKLLQKEGWNLSKFPQMEQITQDDESIENQVEIEQQERDTLKGQKQYGQLNNKQKEIVDYVLSIFDNEGNNETFVSKCLYIDGPGGSGKTFTYTTLYYMLKSRGKIISSMAFTGIAATLLPNGKTVHKTLGLPVPLFSDSTSSIKAQSKEAQYLKDVDVFIWDEAPMAPRYALEVMDRLLRDLMRNDLPFGGKIVILGGDFRQLLPVKQRGTRSEIVNLSIKFSVLWQHFRIFTLTENMRALPQEQEFAQYLLNLGNGLLNDQSDCVVIPPMCVVENNTDNIAKDTYENLIKNKRYRLTAKCAILSARNVDVDQINMEVINLLDESTERLYTSVDTTEKTGDNDDLNETILPEYLNTLNPVNLPPHELRLRKYTVVMLIRNLNISEGLCNGTRLLILGLGNSLLKCEILTGDKSGEIVFLNRITLYCENVYPFTFKRRQFPVKVAFAMTINKSQGQTFEKIAIDLRKDVFNHGQLYVAFSRVKSWNSLKVYTGTENWDKRVKNYVYKEIFH